MAKAQGTLERFVTANKPFEGPVFTSQEIRDRGSLFVANIYHASSPKDAQARVQQMKNVVHSARPATHEISAWRCMVLKPGRSGLGGPEDFELQAGSKDDGESWAGAKVLAVMETLSIIDAVVIVSRWWVMSRHQAQFCSNSESGMAGHYSGQPGSPISKHVPQMSADCSKTGRN